MPEFPQYNISPYQQTGNGPPFAGNVARPIARPNTGSGEGLITLEPTENPITTLAGDPLITL